MKSILELTNQELNEWVIKEIFNSSFKDMTTFTDRSNAPHYFYPVHNLKHTHLMEEKIREMGKGNCYAHALNSIFHKDGSFAFSFDLIHATARQKCEAAWLAFNEDKK